jgi:hypothetical protein
MAALSDSVQVTVKNLTLPFVYTHGHFALAIFPSRVFLKLYVVRMNMYDTHVQTYMQSRNTVL